MCSQIPVVAELNSTGWGVTTGAIAAVAFTQLPLAVGALYGGVSTIIYLAIDRGLACVIGTSLVAKTIRVTLAIFACVICGAMATSTLIAAPLLLADAVVITLATVVAMVIAPYVLTLLTPCCPCFACCLVCAL